MEPTPASDQSQEELIAQWMEPTIKRRPFSKQAVTLISLGALLATALFIMLGIYQHDATFYLGATVALVGGASMLVQNRTAQRGEEITITTQHVFVGTRSYDIGAFAGFWLEQEGGHLTVNAVLRKGSLVPISFLYAKDDPTDARETLTAVLAEVERPPKTISDKINDLVHF